MNPNPYHLTAAHPTGTRRRRFIRRWIAAAMLSALFAWTPLQSGIHLVGQEFGLFPVRYGVFDIKVNGVPISNRTFMWSSQVVGGLLLVAAMTCLFTAFRNHRYNNSAKVADGRSGG